VIVMSTKGVPRYEPVPTTWPPRPESIYGATKLLVEVLVRQARAAGLSCAAIRLATTWGPGKGAETHPGFALHAELVDRILRGIPVELDTDPESGYDLVYYADVAAGLVAATFADAPLRGPVYHLGSGRIVTLGEFVQTLSSLVPGARITLGKRLAEGRHCRLDIRSAERDFGYRPQWLLRAALEDCISRWASGP
jgi:nucleoside-diphosphate-sugar epimerase